MLLNTAIGIPLVWSVEVDLNADSQNLNTLFRTNTSGVSPKKVVWVPSFKRTPDPVIAKKSKLQPFISEYADWLIKLTPSLQSLRPVFFNITPPEIPVTVTPWLNPLKLQSRILGTIKLTFTDAVTAL